MNGEDDGVLEALAISSDAAAAFAAIDRITESHPQVAREMLAYIAGELAKRAAVWPGGSAGPS